MTRAAILVLALLASACTEDAATSAQQRGEASGEVLAGSISDAMIPLEQLDSQAPLAPRQAQAVGEDIDAEQPEVEPVEGIDGVPAAAEAPAASAAPAPAPGQP
jgi:hypothetical protein